MSDQSPAPKPPIEPRYLGDGVYASFDGYHIWLTLGDHRNAPMIALEPQVFDALTDYARKVWNA